MSMGQWLSLPMVVVGLAMFFYHREKTISVKVL